MDHKNQTVESILLEYCSHLDFIEPKICNTCRRPLQNEISHICLTLVQCKPKLSYCPMPISMQRMGLLIPQTTEIGVLKS